MCMVQLANGPISVDACCKTQSMQKQTCRNNHALQKTIHCVMGHRLNQVTVSAQLEEALQFLSAVLGSLRRGTHGTHSMSWDNTTHESCTRLLSRFCLKTLKWLQRAHQHCQARPFAILWNRELDCGECRTQAHRHSDTDSTQAHTAH